MKTAFALFIFSALVLVSLVLVSGTEVKPCVEKTTRCSLDSRGVEQCQNGQWISHLKCFYECENKICKQIFSKVFPVNDRKVACIENTRRCNIESNVEQCEGNEWTLKQDCAYRCQDSRCVEKPQLQKTISAATCKGCFEEGKCFALGSWGSNSNYCTASGWVPLKRASDACKVDYECNTKKCENYRCKMYRLLTKPRISIEKATQIRLIKNLTWKTSDEPVDVVRPNVEQRAIQVTPLAGIPGTIFSIYANNVTDNLGPLAVTATFRHESDEEFTELLYNDGLHDDAEAGDEKFAGTWDSTDAPLGRYIVRVTAIDTGGNSESKEFMQPVNLVEQFPCNEVIPEHNNVDGNRTNVVFVFVNYNQSLHDNLSIGEFGREVAELNNHSLLSIEPFASNADKFNFHYVDAVENVDNYSTGFGFFASEAREAVTSLSASCIVPNKKVVGFIDWYFRSNAAIGGEGARISLWEEGITKTMNETSRITSHEFGHSFGALLDEYEEGNPTATESNDQCFYSPAVNCTEVEYRPGFFDTQCENTDESVSACLANSSWRDLITNECTAEQVSLCTGDNCNLNCRLQESCLLTGCKAGSNLIRHNFNNIMRFHYLDPFSYGLQNQRLLCRKIAEYTGTASGACEERCLEQCAEGEQCIEGECSSE